MFIGNSYPYNYNDYCTCNRCPCCGKVVRPRPLHSYFNGTGTTLLNCGSGTLSGAGATGAHTNTLTLEEGKPLGVHNHSLASCIS